MILTNKNIGAEIQRLATEKGIRLKELAAESGVPAGLFSEWKKEEPNTVKKIRHILNVLESMEPKQ